MLVFRGGSFFFNKQIGLHWIGTSIPNSFFVESDRSYYRLRCLDFFLHGIQAVVVVVCFFVKGVTWGYCKCLMVIIWRGIYANVLVYFIQYTYMYPYAPCMEYLPTFGLILLEMYVNMPYMEHLGYNGVYINI